jgi:hypothetical protein
MTTKNDILREFPRTRRALRSVPRGLRNQSARGTVLVFSVFLLLIFFGIAALIMDLGNARISQRQMQSATDYAAIQGLRGRDDPFTNSRVDAQTAVRQAFDDDLVLGVDAQGITAGRTPLFSPASAPGQLNAPQSVVGFDDYGDPILELNDGTGSSPVPNEPHGDMLAGFYDPSQRHDEGYDLINPYNRDDFTPHDPNLPGPEPTSFLVRMRRTRDAFALDNLAGVSSAGPAFQFLFARGALMRQTGGYDPIAEGMDVHAQSIADAQPALSVGPQRPANALTGDIPGMASVALSRQYYNALNVAPAFNVGIVSATGQVTTLLISPGILRDGQLIGKTRMAAIVGPLAGSLTVVSTSMFPPAPFKIRVDEELMEVTATTPTTLTVTRGVDGTTPAAHGLAQQVYLHASSSIGDPIVNAPRFVGSTNFSTQTEVYAPIFEDLGGGAGERIIGYGRVNIVQLAANTFLINRVPDTVGPANAMGVTARRIDPTLTNAQVDQVFALRNTIDAPLRAPVLVRSSGL